MLLESKSSATADYELRTLNDVSRACEDYASKRGFSYVLFWFRVPLLTAQPVQFVLTNYPREWIERYRDRSCMKIDPAVQRMMSALGPFALPESSEDPGLQALIRDAGRHGLCGAFCVPLHGPHGAHAAMTLAGGAIPVAGAAREQMFADALLFASRVFAAVLEIVASQTRHQRPGELSERQRQILTAIAEGRTGEEIAEQCDVSKWRVKQLVALCCAKLGVATREQALMRALASGQIHPATYPSSFKIASAATRTSSLFAETESWL